MSVGKMKTNTSLLFFLSIMLFLSSCTAGDEQEKHINQLLLQMTLEEKIGQMNQLEGGYITPDLEGQIRAGQCGALLNCVGADNVNRLQKIAVEESRLGIPLLVGRDVIHGFRTIYPIPLGQAATWHPELIEYAARLTAEEALQAGIKWAFSPMVDVARDPRWGRIAEGYGEDTYLTSVMGAATVWGYQQDTTIDNCKKINGMAACVKHFAGYSASEGGRDYNTTWIPEVQFRDVYLPPFKAAIDAGAASLMCSFNDLNGLPSTANQWLNVDLLRQEWGFNGLLVSDWGSGSDLVPHGLCADKKDAALRSLNARMEMDMQGLIYNDYLKELLQEGKIKESQIDDCVRSILRIKFRLGLFDNPYAPETKPKYYTEEAMEAATTAVEESAILLKNNGILPLIKTNTNNRLASSGGKAFSLSSDNSTILLCGPLADQKKEQLGTWIFDGEPEHSITPRMAFQQLADAGQVRLLYEPGLTYSRDKNTDFSKVIKKAKQADVILFFCGEEAILSGEARCRADLNLPGAQSQMMEALARTGKPVVMVVMAGRPLTIGKEIEQAAAVLYSFHAGTMAGPGLANIIMGKVVPSGKTPVTFPKMVGQIPLYYNRHNTGRPSYDPPMLLDDIPIGCPQFSIGQSSYWLDTPTEPLFPFGYGLSYTTFEYGETTISGTPLTDSVRVSCTITNTGNYDAYETAQLYTHQLSGELVRPIKELKGFSKIWIPAGETRAVEFTLTKGQLGYWHEHKQGFQSKVWFYTDPLQYELWVAPHSDAPVRRVTFSVAE